MTYLTVANHRSMALDRRRNDAYAAALRTVIESSSVVLDLGAGTGIHGLIAARLGARRVYLVEPEDIILVAEEIAEANGLQDVVRCLQGRLEDLPRPEPVDLIVSALTGNFLVTEDLLRTLFFARDHWLRPNGFLIPSAARMEAVPVSAADLHFREIDQWSEPQHAVNLSAARPYAANTIFYRADAMHDLRRLADPRVLCTFDFHSDVYRHVDAEVTYEISESGACHGWVGWFSIKLGDRWLSTSPYEERLHWSPAFLPLDPAVPLERGEQVSFALQRAPLGDWTWSVRTDATYRQHSTFLSAPLSAAMLSKAAVAYAPSLGDDGRALAHVLAQCDGSASVDLIARSLREKYPQRYPSRDDAIAFVHRIVKRYA